MLVQAIRPQFLVSYAGSSVAISLILKQKTPFLNYPEREFFLWNLSN